MWWSWRWLLPVVAILSINPRSASALPVPDEEVDTSTRLLGSSVVTSVSVVMGLKDGNTEEETVPGSRNAVKEMPASPADLLRPDRFQFYTFNEKGGLVKNQMTEKEIQSIIAAGGGQQNPMEAQGPQKAGDVPTGGMKVADVVQNVQNVLKGELSKPTTAMSSVPTIPGHANSEWSSILPMMLGGEAETAPVTYPESPVVTEAKPPGATDVKNEAGASGIDETPPASSVPLPQETILQENSSVKDEQNNTLADVDGDQEEPTKVINENQNQNEVATTSTLAQEAPDSAFSEAPLTTIMDKAKPQHIEKPVTKSPVKPEAEGNETEKPMIQIPVITAGDQSSTKQPSSDAKPVFQMLNTISADAPSLGDTKDEDKNHNVEPETQLPDKIKHEVQQNSDAEKTKLEISESVNQISETLLDKTSDPVTNSGGSQQPAQNTQFIEVPVNHASDPEIINGQPIASNATSSETIEMEFSSSYTPGHKGGSKNPESTSETKPIVLSNDQVKLDSMSVVHETHSTSVKIPSHLEIEIPALASEPPKTPEDEPPVNRIHFDTLQNSHEPQQVAGDEEKLQSVVANETKDEKPVGNFTSDNEASTWKPKTTTLAEKTLSQVETATYSSIIEHGGSMETEDISEDVNQLSKTPDTDLQKPEVSTEVSVKVSTSESANAEAAEVPVNRIHLLEASESSGGSVTETTGTSTSQKTSEVEVAEPVLQLLPELKPQSVDSQSESATPEQILQTSTTEKVTETANHPTENLITSESSTAASIEPVLQLFPDTKPEVHKIEVVNGAQDDIIVPEEVKDPEGIDKTPTVSTTPTSLHVSGTEKLQTETTLQTLEALPTELADSVSSMISQISDAMPSLVPIPQGSEPTELPAKRVNDAVKTETTTDKSEEVKITEPNVTEESKHVAVETTETKSEIPLNVNTEAAKVENLTIASIAKPEPVESVLSTTKEPEDLDMKPPKTDNSKTELPGTTVEAAQHEAPAVDGADLPSPFVIQSDTQETKHDSSTVNGSQSETPALETIEIPAATVLEDAIVIKEGETPAPIESTSVKAEPGTLETSLTKTRPVVISESAVEETAKNPERVDEKSEPPSIVKEDLKPITELPINRIHNKPSVQGSENTADVTMRLPMDDLNTPSKTADQKPADAQLNEPVDEIKYETDKPDLFQNSDMPIVRINITEGEPVDEYSSGDLNPSQISEFAVAEATESPVVRIQLTDTVSTINRIIEGLPDQTTIYPMVNLTLPKPGSGTANTIASSLIAGSPTMSSEMSDNEKVAQAEVVSATNQLNEENGAPSKTQNIETVEEPSATSAVDDLIASSQSGLTNTEGQVEKVEDAAKEPADDLPVSGTKTEPTEIKTEFAKPADTKPAATHSESSKGTEQTLLSSENIVNVDKTDIPIEDQRKKTTQSIGEEQNITHGTEIPFVRIDLPVIHESVSSMDPEASKADGIEIPSPLEPQKVAESTSTVSSDSSELETDVKKTVDALSSLESSSLAESATEAEDVKKTETFVPPEIIVSTTVEVQTTQKTTDLETAHSSNDLSQNPNITKSEKPIQEDEVTFASVKDNSTLEVAPSSAPSADHETKETEKPIITEQAAVTEKNPEPPLKMPELPNFRIELPVAVGVEKTTPGIETAATTEAKPAIQTEGKPTETPVELETNPDSTPIADQTPVATITKEPEAPKKPEAPVVRTDISPEISQTELPAKIQWSDLPLKNKIVEATKTSEANAGDGASIPNSESSTTEAMQSNIPINRIELSGNAEVPKRPVSDSTAEVPEETLDALQTDTKIPVRIVTDSSAESGTTSPIQDEITTDTASEPEAEIPSNRIELPASSEMQTQSSEKTTVKNDDKTPDSTEESRFPTTLAELVQPPSPVSPESQTTDVSQMEPVVGNDSGTPGASEISPTKTHEVRIQVNDTAVLVTKHPIEKPPPKLTEILTEIPDELPERIVESQDTTEKKEPFEEPITNPTPATTDKPIKEEIVDVQGSDPYVKLGEQKPAKPTQKTPSLSNKKADTETNGNVEDKWTLIPQNVPAPLKNTAKPIQKPSGETNANAINDDDKKDAPVTLIASQTAVGLGSSTQNLDNDVAYFSNLCNELAFSFWTAANKGLSTARSLALSPFGMTSMLAMVFLGARGPTSGQMNDVLKLDDVVTFNPHLVFQNVTDSVNLARGQGIANAAFVRELFADKGKAGKLLPFYKERAQQFYDGHVEEVKFATISDLVRRRTNLLIRRQTGGRIRDFVKGNTVPLRSPLAALSANVFQTDCSGASSEGRDGEMYFAVLPAVRQRKLVPVPATVWQSGVLAGYEPGLDATAIALGGTNNLVSTIFVVPGQQGRAAPGDSLDRLEQRLLEGAFKQGVWERLLKVLIPRMGLELQVPKFSHRSVVNATAALKRMGLEELFSRQADLKGINGVGNDLHLADMLQMNLFSTCGDEVITGGRHHVEVYPASPLRNARMEQVESEEAIDQTEDDLSRSKRTVHHPKTSQDPEGYHESKPKDPTLVEKPRFKLDSPFLYFVRHNPTGLILHMGRFNPRLLP